MIALKVFTERRIGKNTQYVWNYIHTSNGEPILLDTKEQAIEYIEKYYSEEKETIKFEQWDE